MQKLSYGVPLFLLTAGTAVSAAGGKNLHLALGAALVGTSLLHSWQHKKKLAADAAKGVNKVGLLEIMNLPKNRLELIIHSVDVASYLPGRIRLRSKHLVGNSKLREQVMQELGAFAEIDEIDINTLTGSILIKYEPVKLRKNVELDRIEQYIMKQAKGRR